MLRNRFVCSIRDPFDKPMCPFFLMKWCCYDDQESSWKWRSHMMSVLNASFCIPWNNPSRATKYDRTFCADFRLYMGICSSGSIFWLVPSCWRCGSIRSEKYNEKFKINERSPSTSHRQQTLTLTTQSSHPLGLSYSSKANTAPYPGSAPVWGMNPSAFIKLTSVLSWAE